jgi:hypothetical protein
MNIFKSAAKYEDWLRSHLDDVVEKDIAVKHEKMAEGAFQFLRATYWRWAETIDDLRRDLKDAPHVLAVGDIHVENFGTWRDAEGRLVWGVNDFDEAAKMPYALDIVRLAASALLAKVPGIGSAEICTSIAEGYAKGLKAPAPFVLDHDHKWLRDIVVVSDHNRKKFWEKFDPARIAEKKPDKIDPVAPEELRRRFRKAIERAQPDSGIALEFYSREAGTGSLGRPRFFGVGSWQGGLIVREAKAMARSGWTLVHGGAHRLRCAEIAAGPYRSPDPTYHLRGHVLVRRLSPNDFKIEVEQPKKKDKAKKAKDEKVNALPPAQLINADMLHAMGRELASIHRGTREKDDIEADFQARGNGWLLAAVTSVAAAITAEQREWEKHPEKWPPPPKA